jgi:hypothetical protein
MEVEPLFYLRRSAMRAFRRLLLLFLGLAIFVPASVSAQGIAPLTRPELSGEWIAGLVYVLLMIAIEFVPRFSAFWDAFQYKRETVAGVGLLTVIALVGLHYLGAFDLSVGPFGWHVIGEAINAWLAFLGGSWVIWSVLEKAGALPRKRISNAG